MISSSGHLTILESVDSTNNYAMARVRTGLAKNGDAFFAMAQVKGKGQRGKTWITERGTNIIITLILQPGQLSMQQQFPFSAAVALGVHDFYASYAGDETSIKWPNDIYWRDRKAGGILIENIIGAKELGIGNSELGRRVAHDSPLTTWQWSIIGMGMNINQTIFPPEIRNPVSLKQITGKDWDVVAMAKEMCDHVQNRCNQLQSGADILKLYNEKLFKKGQRVKFKKDHRVFEGLVQEVNQQGELVLFTAMEERFGFGEIEWILD